MLKYVNTRHTPQRLDTCRGLPEVKWAFDWLIQQSSFLNNTTANLPQRYYDKQFREGHTDSVSVLKKNKRMQQLPGPRQMGRVVQLVRGGRGKVAYIPQKEHIHTLTASSLSD